MADKTESIIEEVLHLPRESRALLAEKLLESLDHEETFVVSPEWMDEIRKRCREIDAGMVTLSSSEAVFEELDKNLGGSIPESGAGCFVDPRQSVAIISL